MSIERWKKVKPLDDSSSLTEIEAKIKFPIPQSLRKCILENNGGRPVPNAISLPDGDNDVKCLLSYNRGDTESIFKILDFFIQNYLGSLLPFAMDSAGNYYCVQGEKIVLWTQENEIVHVCDSFDSFVNSLFEL